MLKILYLTPWYPTERDKMSGLFVQKHAEAARSVGMDIRVIHSEKWHDLWRQWRQLSREGWRPDVVQLNILQKQGLLALWLKRRYGIPYIVVEHWSGYLPENGQFMRLSRIKRGLYNHIAGEAEIVLCVSQRHMQAMQQCGIQAKQWGTINNVVDDFFFEDRSADKVVQTAPLTEHRQKNLLHVSCFDERAKNVKGLLRAAKRLSDKRKDWHLTLVGTGIDYADVRAYANTLHIPEGLLEWTGELTPREVADEMQRADALVLSSRYETYGVVLAEAVAAGLPILSTPVGIAEEVADLIVPQEIAQHKAGTFAEFMETILFRVESRKSKVESERFTSEAVGKTLKEAYDSCLHRDI